MKPPLSDEEWEAYLAPLRPTTDPARLADLDQLAGDLWATRRSRQLSLTEAARQLDLTPARLVSLELHPQGNDGRHSCVLAPPITPDEETAVRAWLATPAPEAAS